MVKSTGIMIGANVRPGKNSPIYHRDLVNVRGYEIGDGCTIGAFVGIRTQAKISRNVRIQGFAPILEGAVVVDGAFIGPQVCFANDRYPRAVNPDGTVMEADDWEIVATLLKRGAVLVLTRLPCV